MFLVDESVINADSEHLWLWVAIEARYRRILALPVARERNMFVVAERLIAGLAGIHGKHPVSMDGSGTWHPRNCRLLKPNHHIHSPSEKSTIERTMHHIKERMECFDDCFPCNRKRGCSFFLVKNWLSLFAAMPNKRIPNAQFKGPYTAC